MKLDQQTVEDRELTQRREAAFPIVYFGNDWAAENRTSSHHIARWLGHRHPVLYVDSPGLRAPKSTGRDLRKIGRKLALALRDPEPAFGRISVVTVPQIPFRRLPGVRALNTLAGVWMVRRAMKRTGMRRPLLWYATPDLAHLAGRLSERGMVYYCIDDYASLPNIDRREVARMDHKLTSLADQVFVSSPALIESKRTLNATTQYSPHGVDVDLFAKALEDCLPVAEGARNLSHPVVGFFGLIEDWLDLKLLEWLGEQRPQWTFLMIGRVATDLGRLAQLPNFVFPGVQPYETLPSWAKAFDVGIIPFRQNELVRSVNPLKLREYLATGKPVVSVPMPEVDRFAHCIGIAHNREEFLACLEQAIFEDSLEKRAARMRTVAGMTWDARMQDVMLAVHQRLLQS